MKIPDLLATEFGESVSVTNEPFTFVGKAEIKLDDGTKMHWLYDDEDHMMSVAPDEEEIILFLKIQEEIEPSDIILFQTKEYEFSYEDAGVVVLTEGDPLLDVEDRIVFSDYQSKDGETVRIVTNENTSEITAYVGHTAVEDDVLEI